MEQLEQLKQYIKENLPSAEIYEIQSSEGKIMFEQSLDGKECSGSTICKKQGITILLANY